MSNMKSQSDLRDYGDKRRAGSDLHGARGKILPSPPPPKYIALSPPVGLTKNNLSV